MRKNVSVTILLLVAVGGLVLIATGAVLLVTGYASLTNTRELLIEKANMTVDSLEQGVRAHVRPARNLVDHLVLLASRGDIDVSNNRDVVTTLKSAMAAAPQVLGVSIWQQDGQQTRIDRTDDDGFVVKLDDFRTNTELLSYFNSLRSHKKAQWNPPYWHDDKSFISVSRSLFFNDSYVGAASAAISLKDLSKYVQSQGADQQLQGFILYGDDQVLAHRALSNITPLVGSEGLALHSLKQLADPVLTGLKGSFVLPKGPKGRIDARQVSTKNGRYLVLLRKISDFGETTWTLGTYARLDSMDSQIKRFFRSIIIGLLLLVFSLIAALFIARRIAAPIKSTALAADKIGQMNLEEIAPLPPSNITELNNLARAFNQMLDGLRWFETYVPRRLVNRLMREQGDMQIISSERILTVMFTDIVGFTAMSEDLSPAETAELLNAHFEIMNRCIEAENGTLDKYIGDAVMAFWGAPEQQDDHALRACRAALAIRKAHENSDQSLRIKIAIHTGPLIVGNIGAKGRMNYTVIGDTVNTCSRIEKLASKLDDGSRVSILVSAETAADIKDKFKLEPAGKFSVKGRKKVVQVLRLIG